MARGSPDGRRVRRQTTKLLCEARQDPTDGRRRAGGMIKEKAPTRRAEAENTIYVSPSKGANLDHTALSAVWGRLPLQRLYDYH